MFDPVDPIGPESLPAPARRRPAGRPLDVLVVEDDPASRRSLELALGHLGCLVVSADSVRAALALLDALIVDVVLCDVRLPDGDGRDLLATVGRSRRRPAAIAMTGDPTALRPDHGFSGQLVKPFALEALQALIDAARDDAEAGRR